MKYLLICLIAVPCFAGPLNRPKLEDALARALKEKLAETETQSVNLDGAFWLLDHSKGEDREAVEALFYGSYQANRIRGARNVKRFLMEWAERAEEIYAEKAAPLFSGKRSYRSELFLRVLVSLFVVGGVTLSEMPVLGKVIATVACFYYLASLPVEEPQTSSVVESVPGPAPLRSRARNLFVESLSEVEVPYIVVDPKGNVISISQESGELALTFISTR